MVRKLPNELLYEMAKYIPYKPSEDPGSYWTIFKCKNPKVAPILSSTTLSFYIANKWRKIKKKRQEMLKHIVNKIEDIRKGDNQNTNENYWDQKMMLYLNGPYIKLNKINKWERKIGWYWDEPRENENILCTLCLKWEKYEKGNFDRCPNSIHVFHKECYKKFIELSCGIKYSKCHTCYPFWYDNFSHEYV